MAQIQHIKDDNFDDLIINSERIHLVYFSAHYCRHCKRYRDFFKTLHEDDLEFQVGAVDIDESITLSDQYDIRLLPTTIFFSAGIVIDRKVGILSLDEIKDVLYNV